MFTIQIVLTNDPPRKWSTNVEHLSIHDLTGAVLRKLDPRGEDLTVRQVKNTGLWKILLGIGDIGTIENLTRPFIGFTLTVRGKEATPHSKPVVKDRHRRPRTKPSRRKTKPAP